MPGPVVVPPVTKLPTELLARIFELLATDYPELAPGDPGTSERLSWIVVTHVCKRWYEVAKENARLWSTIEFACPLWSLEMLKRSKGAPLRLTFVQSDRDQQLEVSPDEVMTKALTKLRFVRKLAISSPSVGHIAPFIEAMCGEEAPILESLHIHQGEWSPEHALELGNYPAFLNGSAPSLREVVLLGCTVDPNARPFRNARAFHLMSVQMASLLDTLTLISNLPLVEELTVGYVFGVPTGEEQTKLSRMEKLTMNHLVSLRLLGVLREELVRPTELLQWLVFPKPPTIKLTCSLAADHGGQAAYGHLFDPVFPHYPSGGFFDRLEVVRRFGARDELLVSAFSPDGTICQLSLAIPDDTEPEGLENSVVMEFARRMPRQSLHELYLRFVTLDWLDFEEVFSRLPRLEMISASVDDTLLRVLKRTDDDGKYLLDSLATLKLFYDPIEVPPPELLDEMYEVEHQVWTALELALRGRIEGRDFRIRLDLNVPNDLVDIIKSEQLGLSVSQDEPYYSDDGDDGDSDSDDE